MSNKSVLLVGNWKMNLGPTDARLFAKKLRENIQNLKNTGVWVTPSPLSAYCVVEELRGSPIEVGAQNVHWTKSGAFTGETSPSFARELGLTFSLVGHSERRSLFGETSESVALRMKAAIDEGLSAIVCVGETEAERAAGLTRAVLTKQLEPIFAHLERSTESPVILAYEPVWAIGTGKVASELEIQETHAFLKELWSQRRGTQPCRILYGGSVTPQNFQGIIVLPEVDGALVGGASIKLDSWLELISIAQGAQNL